MIIVQLKGGLGNQLFQYAAGLSLSKHHNVPVKVDIAQLERPDQQIGTIRNFDLQHLIVPPAVASGDEIETIKRLNLLNKYFQKLFPSYLRSVYNEKKFGFDSDFFKSGQSIYLKGYRQSEKYFLPYKKEIKNAFQFEPSLVAEVEDYAKEIKTLESVSLHIRRGDYANSMLVNFHGILDEDYYQRAVDKMSSTLANPLFLIFSDNIAWVKANLKFKKEIKFISGNISKNQFEDFYLMQSCKHNIIANSSFSWWAAWLNPNPDKIVITPKKWFNNAPYDTSDLIPPEWIKL